MRDEVPVLIVGGGPAGLTTALWLRQQGIEAMLVERRDFTQHYPRAHLLNVRTMEVFHDIGVAEDVYAMAAPETGWQQVAWYTSLAGPTRLHGRKIGSIAAWGGGPDAERYAQASPRRFANLPQIHLDRILAEHATARCPGRILAGHELTALEITAAGVVADVLDRHTGRTSTVRARYLVAADGGRTVTQLLGVPMHGQRALVDVVSMYVRADLRDYADEGALLTYFVNPDMKASVPGALLALSPGPRACDSPEWSLSVKYRIGDPASENLDAVLARARGMLGLPDLPMQVKAVAHWQYEGLVADTFRVGPVFLVGDAAHRHPPTGGLGLNTAVQDAANLSWKLAAVLNGQAEPGLLDTYEQERLPVAAFNVEHALRNAGRHAPIGEAMGLSPDQSPDEGLEQVAVWASDTPEGDRRRAAVTRAIGANAEDFGQLNVEAGFCYESGAVIDDGTAVRDGEYSATAFRPNARPGHHVPHVWVADGDRRASTVDLVALDRMTLLVGAGGAHPWEAAASDDRVRLVVVPDADFLTVSGIGATGALLVRPDKHVAWRTTEAPVAPAAALATALHTVLAGGAAFQRADGSVRADGIDHAGARLRSGSGVSDPGGSGPRIFETTVLQPLDARSAH